MGSISYRDYSAVVSGGVVIMLCCHAVFCIHTVMMVCCYFVMLLYNRTVDSVTLSVMDTATTAGVISGGVATSPLLVFIVPSILLFYCDCH